MSDRTTLEIIATGSFPCRDCLHRGLRRCCFVEVLIWAVRIFDWRTSGARALDSQSAWGIVPPA
jgi:hypothetical protein